MRLRLLILTTGLAAATTAVSAAPHLYDMGTPKSAVWEGFTQVTPTNLFSETTGFGWHDKEGLKATARALTEPIPSHEGTGTEPPVIWTNPITEDAVTSDRENSFIIKTGPGDYNLYIVCGTSEAARSQYFDFTVRVGDQQQRVQIEGGYQFRSLRFRAKVTDKPLVITLSPRSRWSVNAILAWTDADTARVEKEIIAPFEEWTHRMPPQEWAKWKQDPEPAPGPLPTFSPADQKRGFAVYTRPGIECIYPHTHPRPEDLDPTLQLFAAPGQSVSCNFIVFPLKELTTARVNVSNIGPVPTRQIDVRHVRFQPARPNYRVMYHYRIVPDLLESLDTIDLKPGENARFWLTLRVPDTAPAGNHTGKISFEYAGGKVQIPIQLRILPIRLKEDPEKIFGIYYHHPYDSMAGASDEVSKEYFRHKAELEHADLAAHGTRNVVLSIYSPPADAQGQFKFNWDLLAAKLELWKKYDFRGPIVMSINTSGVYHKYTKEHTGSHLKNIKPPPEAFGQEITAMVRAIETERKQRGWPEFLYYPIDEPGTDPASVQFMVTVLTACKAAGVRTYVTADPAHEAFAPLRPVVDIWCCQPFSLEREAVLADSKARQVEYWCYPNHVNGENDHTPVAGARMTYGFGFWRSGFRALIPWIYSYDCGDPFNYLDGGTQDFFNRHEPDGKPIPVVMWEAYREGYDDYRYIYTLEQLIAEANQSPRPAAKTAAAAGEKELKFIWDSIRVQTKYMNEGLWSPQEFDVYRWMVAQQILAVQDALGKH